MKRFKTKPSKDRKVFRSTAVKTNGKNVMYNLPRGGIRL